MIVSSVRHAVLSMNEQLDTELQPVIASILESLKDPDLSVRRATTALTIALLRHRVHLIRDIIRNLIPQLFDEAKLKVKQKKTGEFPTNFCFFFPLAGLCESD